MWDYNGNFGGVLSTAVIYKNFNLWEYDDFL